VCHVCATHIIDPRIWLWIVVSINGVIIKAKYKIHVYIMQSNPYTQTNAKMSIIIVYRRAQVFSDRCLEIACGEFTHCEIFDPYIGGTFVTSVDYGMQLRFDIKQLYHSDHKNYAWQIITLTKLEYDRMTRWNIEQVETHCKYNYSDLLWQITPFCSYVPDLTLLQCRHPNRMFCSQAVVLALRSAIGDDSTHRMREFVSSMNSRLTTPMHLQKAISMYTGIGFSDKPIPTSVDIVNMYSNRMRY
jgi:hypothetical protein